MRDAGRGNHAHAQHVRTGSGQSGNDSSFQELAGRPGVTADHDGRPCLAGLGKHPHGGAGQTQRQLGGQISVGEPPDTIGAE